MGRGKVIVLNAEVVAYVRIKKENLIVRNAGAGLIVFTRKEKIIV
jgi:hypothetical protein